MAALAMTATACRSGGDNSKRRDEPCSGNAGCRNIRFPFGMHFAGESIGPAVAIGAYRETRPVIIAHDSEVIANRTGLERVVGEPFAQQRGAGVERLRDHLLASQHISHDDSNLAGAG